LLEAGRIELDVPIERVMSRGPVTIAPGSRLGEAAAVLRDRNVDQLPVVDAERRPVGLLDVQDLLGVKAL
jgi:arabinose-5-phosphate isomerase